MPRGLSIDTSVLPGLQGCCPRRWSPGAQEPPASFNAGPADCPAASRLGTLELVSSLPHPLSGDLYLASPGANPFGATFGLYAVLEEPDAPLLLKVARPATAEPAGGEPGDEPLFVFVGGQTRAGDQDAAVGEDL